MTQRTVPFPLSPLTNQCPSFCGCALASLFSLENTPPSSRPLLSLTPLLGRPVVLQRLLGSLLRSNVIVRMGTCLLTPTLNSLHLFAALFFPGTLTTT